MKKFIAILLSLVLLVMMCACGSPKRNNVMYAKSAVVTTINSVKNYVGFTDLHGEEWYWYCDTTTAPWSLDDEVLLVMSNSGTAYMYDDEIVSVTTEGIICETVSK